MEGRAGNADQFVRWRLRTPFVEMAALAHATMREAVPEDFPTPPDLVEEEEQLWERFVTTYVAVFGGPARTVTRHGADEGPTVSPSRAIRIGGAVDLMVETVISDFELRQLELWRRPLCASPMENWSIALAVLRTARWGSGRELRIRHVDLLTGEEDAHAFDYAHGLRAVIVAFDERLAILRARADSRQVQPGLECGMCPYVAGCPAHRGH